MVKLSDALWNKNRHIRLQMIQCDCQENIERICKNMYQKDYNKKIEIPTFKLCWKNTNRKMV